MDNNFNILIAGGDERMIYCAEKLSRLYDISLAGFGTQQISRSVSPFSADRKYSCILLPVRPFTADGKAAFPDEVTSCIAPDGIVLSGIIDNRIKALFPENEIINYMEREDLLLKNAVPTAEGAVQVALEELPVTLSGTSVLIAGLGRIGTALALVLKGFGADITAAVRSRESAAKARILGIRSVCFRDIGGDFGLVFNTVPCTVFKKDVLERFGRDTLFIELASAPGGIDLDLACELGIKTVTANGLPGKNAPVTAGRIIAETIENILTERSELQ